MFLGLYCALMKTAVRSDSESVEQPGIVTILSTEGRASARLTAIMVGKSSHT